MNEREIECWRVGILAGFNACGYDHELTVHIINSDDCVELVYFPDNPSADDEQRMLELEDAFVSSFIRMFGGRIARKAIDYDLCGDTSYSAVIDGCGDSHGHS